jgi:oligosaccharyltransferase complex subunit delta (ribophorin II)
VKPVFVGISGSNVLSESVRVLSIRASDLLGRPLDISVQLDSLSGATDQKKVAGVESIQAVQSSTDKSLYTIDLKGKTIPKGFYNVKLLPKTTKNDKTLILQETSVQIKMIGKLGTVTSRVGISDSDQAKVKWNDLNKGQKLSSKLELDPSQKLIVKAAISDPLHQVFVVLRCKETQREVAFIAQPETDGKTDYKLELDLTTNAKDLGYNSGTYELILYLGDFLIEDSFAWSLGEVKLTVAHGKAKTVNPLYAVSYGPKPEIKHMFRQPEPRPPRFLSDTFTLIVLSPLLILFGLWIKVGANISAFPFSISALAFHLGLASMFGVYGLFWIKLTMFEALKWMTLPSLVTFLAGHRLLSNISEKRTKS